MNEAGTDAAAAAAESTANPSVCVTYLKKKRRLPKEDSEKVLLNL